MFEEMMRRVITGDGADGKSIIILDGPPAASGGPVHEIWRDVVAGALHPQTHTDLGPTSIRLAPDSGHLNVRWFVIEPLPEGVPHEALNGPVRELFASLGAERHIIDQSRHPAMHETETLDVICVLQGDVSLILDGAETRLKPGNVVIQRGVNHAWHAHGGPALLLGVLIDRPLKR